MKKFMPLVSIALLNVVALASYAHQVNVSNTNLDLLAKATLIKPVESKTKIAFTVWLKLRNKSELEQLVHDVYDSNNPHYHQFLIPSLYEQKFAPSRSVEEKVRQFFIAQGMHVQLVNHSVRVKGTVAQIEKTFHIQMNYYQFQNERVYASRQSPKLNSSIAKYITGVTGLSTIPEFHANVASEVNADDTIHDLHFKWSNFTPTALPTDTSLQGFTGANLQKTYNLANIPPINGVHLDGAGQTLVIVDRCGTNGPDQILKDANQYFAANKITPFKPSGPEKNFAIIKPDGSPFHSCPNASSFSREIVLDIESSHTLAPGDNTVLVLGDDQKSILMDVIHTLIQKNFTLGGFSNAYVISNSWSGPEGSIDHSLEDSLLLAAAAGISVNFSSGDCGDNTYATQTKCTGSGQAVNYPSSSPYVTAVGATALFVDHKYRYAFETVWGTVKETNGTYAYSGGTGGGISQVYNSGSWQHSIDNFTAGGYGVINNFGHRRALPDVAMLGDPNTGLLIIAEGAQVKDGGTSLACPLFSASLVLINQARQLLNKGTPIGHAAPYLYQQNQLLLSSRALHLIIPPSVIISGATPPPTDLIQGTPAPASAFTINHITFGWDSALSIEPEDQFWNDATGVGSPNIPNFVTTMANM